MPGKIKSIKVFKKDVILKSPVSTNAEEVRRIYSKIFYNQTGKIIREEKYNNEEEFEQILEFKYDEKGRLIEELMFEDEETVLEKKTFDYDEKGRLSKEFLHYHDGTYDVVHYEYNENDDIVSKKKVDSDNEPEESEFFTYEGKNMVMQKCYDGDNELINEANLKYDKSGNLIEEVSIGHFENNEIKKENEYNDKGRKTASYIYENGKLIEKYIYEENEKEQIINIYEENIWGKSTIGFEYDDNGNITLQREYDSNGNIISEIKKTYQDNIIHGASIYSEKPVPGGFYNYSLDYEYEYYD